MRELRSAARPTTLAMSCPLIDKRTRSLLFQISRSLKGEAAIVKIQGCNFGGCLPEHSHTITRIIFSTAGDKNLGIPSWQFEFHS